MFSDFKLSSIAVIVKSNKVLQLIFFLQYFEPLNVNAIKHSQEGCNQGIGKCKVVAIFLPITTKIKNAFATIPILSRYAKKLL